LAIKDIFIEEFSMAIIKKTLTTGEFYWVYGIST